MTLVVAGPVAAGPGPATEGAAIERMPAAVWLWPLNDNTGRQRVRQAMDSGFVATRWR